MSKHRELDNQDWLYGFGWKKHGKSLTCPWVDHLHDIPIAIAVGNTPTYERDDAQHKHTNFDDDDDGDDHDDDDDDVDDDDDSNTNNYYICYSYVVIARRSMSLLLVVNLLLSIAYVKC